MLAALVLGCAVLAPLFLLYRFHARRWFWHVLSVLGAVVLGSMAPPPPIPDLLLAFLFVFLMMWGIAAPLFRAPRTSAQKV